VSCIRGMPLLSLAPHYTRTINQLTIETVLQACSLAGRHFVPVIGVGLIPRISIRLLPLGWTPEGLRAIDGRLGPGLSRLLRLRSGLSLSRDPLHMLGVESFLHTPSGPPKARLPHPGSCPVASRRPTSPSTLGSSRSPRRGASASCCASMERRVSGSVRGALGMTIPVPWEDAEGLRV
jgi:hypothetical protein